MQSGIAHAIQDLIKNGNPTNPTEPYFDVVNAYPIVKHLFNEKAVKTLENKTVHLVYQYKEYIGPKGLDKVVALLAHLGVGKNIKIDLDWIRKADLVYTFGFTYYQKDTEIALNKIVSAINTVADLDFTKASMMPLGILKLMPTEGELEEKLCVFSYVSLTESGKQYVDEHMPKILIGDNLPFGIEDL
jgi:hypothetical protein